MVVLTACIQGSIFYIENVGFNAVPVLVLAVCTGTGTLLKGIKKIFLMTSLCEHVFPVFL